jgi:catechol 2,3-dioxygenase-like lactoylglutathione lyase family enzyme
MRINLSISLLISLAVTLLAPAVATVAQETPSPDLSGLAHVALRVHDLDASVSFYKKLGFVRAFALSRDGKVYEAFIKINDRQFIELYPVDAKHPETGFLHFCFEGEHLQAVHDFYVTAGLTPTAVKTAGAGNLLFTMPGPTTPTGPQNMEYTEYMPGSLHSKDVGLHLGPNRIADEIMQATIAVEDVAQSEAFYVDKADFVARPGGIVKLPGSTDESLALVPSTSLGLHSRIVLKIGDRHTAERALKRAKLSYEKHKRELVLLDPDGNQNVLSTDH